MPLRFVEGFVSPHSYKACKGRAGGQLSFVTERDLKEVFRKESLRPSSRIQMRLSSLLLLLHASSGFTPQLLCARRSNGLFGRRTVVYARPWKTKEKKSTNTLVKEPPVLNGEPQGHAPTFPDHINATVVVPDGGPSQAAKDAVELMEEFNRYIEEGSREMFGNLTELMDEKLVKLPDDAAKEMSSYLYNMTMEVQKMQQREIERQLQLIEVQLTKPLEELAFSDAALFKADPMKKEQKKKKVPSEEEENVDREFTIAVPNATISETSRSMRTREIIRNLNVAPFYYSITLFLRWFRKLSYPPTVIIRSFEEMAMLIKWRSPMRNWLKKEQTYEEYIRDAELMQAGWKRTGEIAAKGPMARRWAILRRSAEIWAYFSSFYLKERRITNMYNRGRWSKEKFSEERSKLGAEVTQNLLKLGPTFIKV